MQVPGAQSTTVEKDSPPVGPDAIVLALFKPFIPASPSSRCTIILTAPLGGLNTSVITTCRLPQGLTCQEVESPSSLGTESRDGAAHCPLNSP